MRNELLDTVGLPGYPGNKSEQKQQTQQQQTMQASLPQQQHACDSPPVEPPKIVVPQQDLLSPV